MAIINVDGVPVENSTTPAVDGTNASNNIQSFGQLDGGFINALREDDTLAVNTLDADSSGFEVNGNEGDDIVVIDNNVEDTDRATGQVSAFTAFGGKGDDEIDIADLIVSPGSQVFGNIGEDSILVDTGNSIDGLLVNGNEDADQIAVGEFLAGGLTPDFDNSEVYGGKGDDSIGFAFIRNVNNVLLSGDLGNDSIVVGDGFFDGSLTLLPVENLSNSEVVGGDGDDTFTFTIVDRANDNVVNGNTGDDLININDFTGADFINNEIYGGKDNDTILVEPTLEGGLVEGNFGEDFLVLSNLDGVAVNGNADDDTIFLPPVGEDDGTVIDSSIWGGQGDDVIEAIDRTITDSVIAGDKGADSISLVDDDLIGSTVLGGEDDDTIFLGFTTEILGTTTFTTFDGATSVDSDSVIDGGAGDDVIAFDGTEVAIDATILGGEGADTFQLWNGGSVELTDFESGVDGLILGSYATEDQTGVDTILDIDFFKQFSGGTATKAITASLEAGQTLGTVNFPLFTGASFTEAQGSIFNAVTPSPKGAFLKGTQVLFLDTDGSDETEAGLYIYTADVTYNAGDDVTADLENVESQVIALGDFAGTDITVI